MPNFGISAFLRIVHMNVRPQRTELRKRSEPRDGGGYDFHNSLRRLANRMIIEGVPLDEVLADAALIVKEAERNSARQGLRRLSAWSAENAGEILNFQSVSVQSPDRRFSVTYKPNFGLRFGREAIAIHIWNTARPRLENRIVRAVLSQFAESYRDAETAPDDIAVLCLRTMRLIRLGNSAEFADLGRLIMTHTDQTLAEIASDDGHPPVPPDDRPGIRPPGE